jgi:hypothetical protein
VSILEKRIIMQIVMQQRYGFCFFAAGPHLNSLSLVRQDCPSPSGMSPAMDGSMSTMLIISYRMLLMVWESSDGR